MCKELLHTKGNCLPKIKNEKAFTPCGQAAKIIADIVSWGLAHRWHVRRLILPSAARLHEPCGNNTCTACSRIYPDQRAGASWRALMRCPGMYEARNRERSAARLRQHAHAGVCAHNTALLPP